MNNNEAVAYAVCALRELKKQNYEITEQKLKNEMLYLMDTYSEKEIVLHLD